MSHRVPRMRGDEPVRMKNDALLVQEESLALYAMISKHSSRQIWWVSDIPLKRRA